MIFSLLMFGISAYFIILRLHTRDIEIAEETQGTVESFNSFLLVAPILGLIGFILISAALASGRFLERSTHFLIVLIIWLYGASFFMEIMKFYSHKKIVALEAVGVMVSVILAMFLMPLETYCVYVFNDLQTYAYVVGFLILVSLYVGYGISNKMPAEENSEESKFE